MESKFPEEEAQYKRRKVGESSGSMFTPWQAPTHEFYDAQAFQYVEEGEEEEEGECKEEERSDDFSVLASLLELPKSETPSPVKNGSGERSIQHR